MTTRPINPEFVSHCRGLGYAVALPAPDTAVLTCPRCGVSWRVGPERVDALAAMRMLVHLERHPAACRERFPDPRQGP